MKQLISDLKQALDRNQPVIYTALVETRGSTPQKAGAAMLVYPDGSQSGTLGGGCVEADVKRQALKLFQGGERQLLTFQLDSDYGWDDGLICGGRMTMLVDPIHPDSDTSFYRRLIEQFEKGEGLTEAIVIDADREVLGESQATDRYLFDHEDQLIATSGTGVATETVTQNLRSVRSRPRPYVAEGISYLTYLQRCKLVIVGAGHVGEKVAELAADVDFDLCIVDDREEYCNAERFPRAQELVVGEFAEALPKLEIDHNTLCLIVTRGHNHDEEALYHLVQTEASYVGLIGSKRKIKLIFEDLLQQGISTEKLERVYAPIGFDIGSQTVPEIAVSVVAELIAHRNLGAVPAKYRARNPLSDLPTQETM
ncbi:MAG: XdhC family protein [Planctomycetaceae bacterium]|nr:XdhC family protein [Planctomycetaceae bacterium]